MTSNTATTAAQETCPSWCTVNHGDREHVHNGDITQIDLSLAPPCEDASGMRPDYIAVRLWHQPAEMPAPAVGLQHGDDYLPDMTPAEAVELAVALVLGACQITPGLTRAMAVPGAAAPDGDGSCPPWCDVPDHQDYDGGAMKHSLVEALKLKTYPYLVQGTQHHDSLYVTRRQVRDGVPAIVIEKPDDTDADDPAGIMDVPASQVMLTIFEAVEMAISLLGVALTPEALMAMRTG